MSYTRFIFVFLVIRHGLPRRLAHNFWSMKNSSHIFLSTDLYLNGNASKYFFQFIVIIIIIIIIIKISLLIKARY
jgi:hypothetical protein